MIGEPLNDLSGIFICLNSLQKYLLAINNAIVVCCIRNAFRLAGSTGYINDCFKDRFSIIQIAEMCNFRAGVYNDDSLFLTPVLGG